jgi:hypothetical protein
MMKADFLSAVFIVLLGLGVLIEALGMPRYEERDANPYSVPGLVPGFIGVALFVLGSILLVRSIRGGGASGWRTGGAEESVAALLLGPENRRNLVLAVVLTFGYAGGLVGAIDFTVATAIFVSLFILLFEWAPFDPGRKRAVKAVTALVQGILVAVIIAYVFQEVFLVRLP